MNRWRAELRRLEVAQRRIERESKQRQRELERQLKEAAKLTALEKARLEVEAHENALEVLLSVHKEQSSTVDWRTLALALAPHEPPRLTRNELAATCQQAVAKISLGSKERHLSIEDAIAEDDREHDVRRAAYEKKRLHWEKSRLLALRVLTGEARAYTQAVSECAAFAEIAHLGSSLRMTVHDSILVACELEVKGRNVIPAETKSLTTAGKLSVKAMPKARFHEVYQDYVCSCVLRLVREVFALLPVKTVLATAVVEHVDPRTGRTITSPVLSLVAPRFAFDRLDFENLDPSDSLANFQHRGEVTISRKTGEFVPIVPLTPHDLTETPVEAADLAALAIQVSQLRDELVRTNRPQKTGITMVSDQAAVTT